MDSTRSRNVSSPHWMSSKQTTSGACVLEQLPEPPGDLVRVGERLVSPSSELIALRGALRRSPARASCFTTSITGQYVIPSPYERQRPRTIPRTDLLERLGHEPRLPDARITNDRHELAAGTCEHAIPRVHEVAAAHAERPTKREACERSGASTDRSRAVTGNRLPLALQLEQPLLADLDRAGDERAASLRRSAPPPAPPPAPSVPRH